MIQDIINSDNMNSTESTIPNIFLTGTVGKVELIPTSTTAVCERWNVSDKYTWDNVRDLKQLSMHQTLSEDNRSD